MAVLLRRAAYYGHGPTEVSYYSGTSAGSKLVPGLFHVSLNGRPYMLDLNQPFYRQYRRQLAQVIRTQGDASVQTGEQTLDPNSMWRRTIEDWFLGAGQHYQDRKDSVPERFFTSKGIDALTNRWQINLLNDTTLARATTNSNLYLVQAGAYLYMTDGTHVYYATSASGPWTAVASTPAATVSSICSDGFNVWMAYGASGIYHTTAGSSSAADQYVTTAVDAAAVIAYVNARLMLASANVLYNIIATGVLPTPLFTAGNTATRWVAFGEGLDAIYAAGGVGNRSFIWGMTVTADGTTLGAPIVQGQLPPGETVTFIYGALTWLIVGTIKGIRMCSTDATGSITLGSLIPTPHAVGAMVGWDRYCYFGLTAYDSVSTGIGRLDLQNHVIAGVLPAWASDMMAPGGGVVSSVVAFGTTICFAVAGVGLYAPDPTHLVPSGIITSGAIFYDLTDPKTAAQLDIGGPISAGSYTASISTDGGTFDPIGTHLANQVEPVTFGAGPVTGQSFMVQLTLTRDATNPATGPVLNRWTLRSYPAPHRPITWQVPLILNEVVNDITELEHSFDPLVELVAIEAMANLGQMITYQEGTNAYPVFITDVAFMPDYPTRDRHFFNGVALLTLQGMPPPRGA